MRKEERKHRQQYIDTQFNHLELKSVKDEICCDCKGNTRFWWDSDCRYYCDAFYTAMQKLDYESYV